MRGAYGKPQGLVARVDIGDLLISVRVKDQHLDHAVESFRRSKFKFPGRQFVSALALFSSSYAPILYFAGSLLVCVDIFIYFGNSQKFSSVGWAAKRRVYEIIP